MLCVISLVGPDLRDGPIGQPQILAEHLRFSHVTPLLLEIQALRKEKGTYILGTSPPLTEVFRAWRARDAERVSKMSPGPGPQKVSKKSRNTPKTLSRHFPETLRRLPGPPPSQNHGLEPWSRPPQNHGPEIPLCNHFYVLFYSPVPRRAFSGPWF